MAKVKPNNKKTTVRRYEDFRKEIQQRLYDINADQGITKTFDEIEEEADRYIEEFGYNLYSEEPVTKKEMKMSADDLEETYIAENFPQKLEYYGYNPISEEEEIMTEKRSLDFDNYEERLASARQESQDYIEQQQKARQEDIDNTIAEQNETLDELAEQNETFDELIGSKMYQEGNLQSSRGALRPDNPNRDKGTDINVMGEVPDNLYEESTNYDDMSFDDAFGAARKAGLSTFLWNGKSYGTRLAKNETERKFATATNTDIQRTSIPFVTEEAIPIEEFYANKYADKFKKRGIDNVEEYKQKLIEEIEKKRKKPSKKQLSNPTGVQISANSSPSNF